MRKFWAGYEYSTAQASSNAEGWTAVEMTRQKDGQNEMVARVVFWDAEGQFSLEMLVRELPVSIIDWLIREAQTAIQTR
jgi:hypothetical protein